MRIHKFQMDSSSVPKPGPSPKGPPLMCPWSIVKVILLRRWDFSIFWMWTSLITGLEVYQGIFISLALNSPQNTVEELSFLGLCLFLIIMGPILRPLLHSRGHIKGPGAGFRDCSWTPFLWIEFDNGWPTQRHGRLDSKRTWVGLKVRPHE